MHYALLIAASLAAGAHVIQGGGLLWLWVPVVTIGYIIERTRRTA